MAKLTRYRWGIIKRVSQRNGWKIYSIYIKEPRHPYIIADILYAPDLKKMAIISPIGKFIERNVKKPPRSAKELLKRVLRDKEFRKRAKEYLKKLKSHNLI